MGAEPFESTAESNVAVSDESNAPLLPQSKQYQDSKPGYSVATQPPGPVVAAQRHSESASGKDATSEGYHTRLCDCCAEPGGAKLCKQMLSLNA